MAAYYNEIDPYAAQWLKNLIRARLIADGVVDTRSIEDVTPQEIQDFDQCHFFAGIGVWSYALRLAGVPDSHQVWTGSCPCQPFSTAGKGGGFDDERHLWPSFHWLINECQPDEVYGEQVASRDGLGWLDLIQADLEGSGYACGALDTCSASVGAPHIRQRLYWHAKRMADAGGLGREVALLDTGVSRPALGLWQADEYGSGGASVRMGDTNDTRLEGFGRGHQATRGRQGTLRPTPAASKSGRMADTDEQRRRANAESEFFDTERHVEPCSGVGGMDSGARPGPTNGFWRDADWLGCRDGKWRPVEPGTFPLDHGVASRVGRLRAYGNAINAYQAAAFIQAAQGFRP